MIQIAFAGHNRPHDLGDHEPLIDDLDRAFALLKEAGVDKARLLTGLASGADHLAAAAWGRSGLGPIHGILPFLDEPIPPAEDGRPLAQSATWLDGVSTEKGGRNPHLQQTRLLVGAADMLVVVWTGAHARGAGGTADAVRLALDLGLPVLWIQPSVPARLRVLRSDGLAAAFDFAEFQERLQSDDGSGVDVANAAFLRDRLGLDAMEAAQAEPEPHTATPTWLDDWLHSWLWKTYATFRRVVGGPRTGGHQAPPLPADLAEQPGFRILTEAYRSADQRANRLSAVHRSEQILLLLVMVLAAIVGSAPSLFPDFKVGAVAIELWLGLGGLAVWTSAQRARQHERWGESRLLAEQLRIDRAGWALGVSLLGSPVTRMAREEGDLAHDYLRDAGLPHGRFDSARVETWGAWAMDELVGGQSAYHRGISKREGHIAHRVHVMEDTSFLILLIVMFGFLVAELGIERTGLEIPHWVAGAVSMIGTIVPVLGAASMALEAKLELKEQSERSGRIAARLDLLSAQMSASPSLEELQAVARTAMRWLIAEASHWRQGVGRRQLFRP